MKLFACRCGNVVHFENDQCVACKARLAFAPERDAMLSFDDVNVPPKDHRFCENSVKHGACNWLIPVEGEDAKQMFCRACRLNQVIPDLSVPENRSAWLKIEMAKRRLVYTLLSWNLPLKSKEEDPKSGLAFAFLRQEKDAPPVLTGHDDGLITLNIAEADDPFREGARQSLGEAYRTLLGHFRHESGHYYWDRLIRDDEPLHAAFRDLFGDESVTYEDALKTHYNSGNQTNWAAAHVSAYAGAHPWEDWAETWAHYLHLWDTMETATIFGLSLVPRLPPEVKDRPAVVSGLKPIASSSFDEIMAGWPSLTLAINALNRSMGLHDAYPFAPSEQVVAKLRFVHNMVANIRNAGIRNANTRNAGIRDPKIDAATIQTVSTGP